MFPHCTEPQSSPLRAVGTPDFRRYRYGGSQDYREGWRKNHLFFKKKCFFFFLIKISLKSQIY
ncbi:hypothetical protein C9J12_16485 [Photobacterium frigidiphilum]|uniref:Uncharacterized protein n=1 Tax=Photobacterium frigidiphilum TaxID=264736 RepID=A0A2T3JDW4_9GAMM|nr:hypothetical protein C9J12_16485 [Photobacterium frigidiphilum]